MSYSTSTKHPFSSKRPIHWILDWDGTLTKHDTLDALVNIAASTKPSFPTHHHWQQVTQAYLEDYTDTLDRLLPDGVLPKTIAQETELLHDLRAVEQRSLTRVSSSCIFASITAAQLDEGSLNALASRAVELRAGTLSLFQHIQTRQPFFGDRLDILSVNWSRHFIAGTLKAANSPLSPTSILANDIDGLVAGTPSTGTIIPGPSSSDLLLSSGDKVAQLNRLRAENTASGNEMSIVYVGDSWTDLGCLMAADLGICVRDEPMGGSQTKLAEALERLGIECPRLTDQRAGDGWDLVWVSDFEEILAWVQGLGGEWM